MLIYRDFTFDAAHVLDGYSEDHPYGRIHGHSFRARVWIQGKPLKENNMITDLGYISDQCKEIKNMLDHNTLNNVKGLVSGLRSTLCKLLADLKPIYPGGLQYLPVDKVSQYPPLKMIVIYGNV